MREERLARALNAAEAAAPAIGVEGTGRSVVHAEHRRLVLRGRSHTVVVAAEDAGRRHDVVAQESVAGLQLRV